MRTKLCLMLAVAGCLAGARSVGWAQSVVVTLRLDTNAVPVGGGTVLRVLAQVAPALRSQADRIFSWYVDIMNTNGPVARADYDAMQKVASDKDPLVSSAGTSSGANRHGIYDTFLNLPGAGTTNPVELMAIPIQGLAAGTTRFVLRPGTTVAGLAEDFIVSPKDGGDPWTGGDYQLAHAELTVGSACDLRLQAARVPGGPPERYLLQFTPCPGRNHTVETRPNVESGPWQPLPGGPHNGGSVIVTNSLSRQFFRVRSDP